MAMKQDASTGEMVETKEDAAEEGQQPKAKGDVIIAKVYAPFKIYFEGEALSLTAVNETGPFDILPMHHNFLCMLVPGDLVIKTPQKEDKVFKISRALLHVRDNKVTVFVDV